MGAGKLPGWALPAEQLSVPAALLRQGAGSPMVMHMLPLVLGDLLPAALILALTALLASGEAVQTQAASGRALTTAAANPW